MAQIQARAPLWSAADLDSGATLTSAAIPVGLMTSVGLGIKVTHASAAANVSIHYAISPDGGTTYGSYDNEVEAASNVTWAGLNPEDFHPYALAAFGATHIKIRVTEIGTNNNNEVTAYLVFTEDANS